MKETQNYPQFILDKPVGEDYFHGHSQERVSHSICDYVRLLDTKPKGGSSKDNQAVSSMPRIIGLEGGWGTGKSNVVRMIGRELVSDGYYTFTYDAWGHQEDLQRRSILETMTSCLIRDKVLQEKVKIPLRNGKENNDTWTNQLSLLLSNKTTTIRKSTPKLTTAAFWGIAIVALFALCSLVAGQVIDSFADFKCYWWIDFIPVVLAILVAICYWIKDGSFDSISHMVDHTKNDTIDEEYTSSEEPSVTEFKNWLRAISGYLGKSKGKYSRLIIVFDNMDRLPSEKVLQLWSSIYTFFAGGEFERIWAIIPYDYKHLCQAIFAPWENDVKSEDDADRIKQFISKTFPITYHVPQPVITDYRALFNTYFDKAFGPDEHDRDHICQVFMHLEDNPNPRTVIRFVNELVATRLQWNDKKYRLQNQALYILKKDFLFYSGKRTESQLLSDQLFDKIAPFYPDQETVRTEICQYAFGLEDRQLASELPLRNELKRIVRSGESVVEYVSQPNFMPVFETVISETDQAILDKAVKCLASLDGVELEEKDREAIRLKWDFLANLKAKSSYDSHQYDEALTVIIRHATPVRIKQMAKSFVKSMQAIKVSDGASYFHALNNLRMALEEKELTNDDSSRFKSIVCEPEQFVQYVCAAKKQYKLFGLEADQQALNEYLLNSAQNGDNRIATVIDYIKGDSNYDLTVLRNGLSTAITEDRIKENICTAAYIHRVLSLDKDLLEVRFKTETIQSFLKGGQSPWAELKPKGLEDVIAMSLADGYDLDEIDDQMLPRICDCMERYMSYTNVLKNIGKDSSAFRKLNIYCIEQQRGRNLDLRYAAGHLATLQSSLGLSIDVLLAHFNKWPSIDWGELNNDNVYIREVEDYVHLPFFSSYLDNPGNFSDSIISLGVKSLSFKSIGFLASKKAVSQYNRVVNKLETEEYWRAFVETFLGTVYLPKAGMLLTGEAITMLQWLYDHNEVKTPKLLDTILEHADEATLKNYLHTMMNESFSKKDVNKEKFIYFGKLLPMLGADMDANTARGLMAHFIKPVYQDEECASIIVTHKVFYLAIMRLDAQIAQSIAKEMKVLDAYSALAIDLENILQTPDK